MLAALAFIALTALHPPVAVANVDGVPTALPRPAVVVLWASWCVSCRAELRRIPELERAAKPLRVVTLAIDPPAAARRALAAAGRPKVDAFADAREPASVLADWGGKGAALPLTVAIDRNGQVCGTKRGLLGTDQLRQWAARCSR
ncbi:TlpA disulfide reductase family protein [Sphingomonas sp. dw_22]|uniref:TlpA family protein disulfide reductase n=1 Tax=Sphingomonas sp. dw_22 TaxID=2721175 RepID=UPI001BD2DF86|nr:TlpA disulfide reductase family protein [Sphingomonas sp. dw_22]